MSKYSNVNYSRIISECNSALRDLSQYSVRTIKDNLKNDRIFQSACKQKIVSNLDNIANSSSISGSEMVLRKKLTNLINAAGYIRRIQDLERAEVDARKATMIRQYENKVDSLLR